MQRSLWITIILGVQAVTAAEFQPMGYKATGMGGAGVASVRDTLATYYNPALLAWAGTGRNFSMGLGGSGREGALGLEITRLDDNGFEYNLPRIAANAPNDGSNRWWYDPALEEGIAIILRMDGKADQGQGQASGHILYQRGSFAFGFLRTGEGYRQAHVDQEHSELIVQNRGNYYVYNPKTDTYYATSRLAYESTSIEYAIYNGLTRIEAHGLDVYHFPAAYGRSVDTGVGQLAIGGALKALIGLAYTRTIPIITPKAETNPDDVKVYSVTLDADLGLAFAPASLEALTLGIVGKHLASPTFRTPEKPIRLNPMVRAGMAYSWENVEIAADLDLSKNHSALSSVRTVGGGIAWTASNQWLSLYGGAMTNLEKEGSGAVYTFGASSGGAGVWVHLGVQLSEYYFSNSDVYPKEFAIDLALEINVAQLSDFFPDGIDEIQIPRFFPDGAIKTQFPDFFPDGIDEIQIPLFFPD